VHQILAQQHLIFATTSPKYRKALMDAAKSLIPSELIDFLLNIAPIRPVFIWGPPGIGKSSLVEAFADSVGLPCVSLLGSQLAPEDLIGVWQRSDAAD
jgi:replication-associated recombination protein RarA